MAPIDISIVDSRDDAKVCFIVVDDCRVSILKTKLNDLCYIMKVVGDICHIQLDTKGCEDTKR